MILLFIMLNAMYSENSVVILESNPFATKVQVKFSEVNRGEQLPVTRFILAQSRPRIEYTISQTRASRKPDNNKIHNTKPVEIGEPITVKGFNLYPIVVHPSYLDQSMRTFYESIEITLNYTPLSENFDLSPSLQKVFKHLILNFRENGDLKPLGYLIITPDMFYDEVLPLARWKEKKGWHVSVKTLSETGSLPAEIKNYIADAYNTWSPPPEYVLLIGDAPQLPPGSYTIPVRATDYPYTLIDGDDFFAELLIGRLSAQTAAQLNTIIAKILGYEQTPYMTDPTWFTRALMVAADYPIDTMTTPIATKRWVRDRLFDYGLTTVDTVYYPPVSGPTQITSSVDQGVLFVNYRGGIADPDGWVYPNFHNADVVGLSNGWKLPIVTSITCYTGDFRTFETCFGEAWLRYGSPTTPNGCVAFIGASSPGTHSRWNNCLDQGIYWAFLNENINTIGPAFYRGKMEVFMNFPGDTSWASGSSFYFHTYNLLGDPSLDVWSDVPDTFIVSHSDSIPVGTNSLSVQVQNSSSQPVERAMVSLYKENEVKKVEFTDASGHVSFNYVTSIADTLFVTVTKHNFKPYCGHSLVHNMAVYVGYNSHTISDPTGNNNGEVNPGETIETAITLRNFGTSTTATNVMAKLMTTDSLVTITDSIKSYGDITPGGTATAAAFVFDVSTNTKNNHTIKCNLEVTSNQGTWNSSVWIDVKAPEFCFQWHQILDGNGFLEPAETSDMIVSIENTGGLIGNNISGILRSLNPGVSVTDSIGAFGNLPIGDSSANYSNHFTVSASSSITPGHAIGFVTMLSGDNDFKDTVEFEIVIGVVNQTEPLGRDLYGYFAYDNTDIGYPESPTYDWVEIDPELGGPGDTLSLGKDETKTIALLFNFKFYGNWYDRISVCSNGYIAMDSTWIADMYNWHIPAAGGPPLLIAPFWDDLDPNATDSSGNVCYWYDASNHRFIVEYSRIQHIHNPTNPTPAELQTFEVILFDPQHYPTETGDGEIIFQYKDITNDDIWHNHATVGIENYGHTIGLEYTYDNIYPAAAAPLANNRAIKFTTDPPDTFPGVDEHDQNRTGSFVLDIYPNPCTQIANIQFQIPAIVNSRQKSVASLKIYDISGRLIRDFGKLTNHQSLINQLIWDATDNAGRKVPEGIYFIQLEGAEIKIMRKVIFLK